MWSEVISSVCAVLGLIATIIIACVQYKQGKRMEELAKRQDDLDIKHHNEYIKAKCDTFIMKYNNDKCEIFLLPLCWMASVYDSTFSYSREMYREFNSLEEEIQEEIFKTRGLTLKKPEEPGYKVYYQCIQALEAKEKDYSADGQYKPFFYDNGKYFSRCISLYKSTPLQALSVLEDKFTDVLHMYDKNPEDMSNPLESYKQLFDFYGTAEDFACEICAVAAKWIAQWNSDIQDEENFWIPGEYSYEQLETHEDLFLCALFCVYVYLVRGGARK